MLQNLKPEDMEEFISKHIFERSYYYNFAKFKINTDKKDNQTVVNEILNILNTNENIH
jgi:shikimate kinase